MKLLVCGLVFLLGAANGGGCSNPNYIGVQQYGSITGRVLDASDNQPVPSALVSVGSLYTAYTDAQGAFTLGRIPIGHQMVTATAPGYSRASRTVRVVQSQTASIDYLRLAPLTGGPTAPPPAPPPTPAPTAEPSATPAPAANGSTPTAS